LERFTAIASGYVDVHYTKEEPMTLILSLIAAALVIYGIITIVRGGLALGVVLIVLGLLVGPGGVSLFHK
jgi:hypothetical protein